MVKELSDGVTETQILQKLCTFNVWHFREMEWGVATSWQLRDLCANSTGSTWLLRDVRGSLPISAT